MHKLLDKQNYSLADEETDKDTNTQIDGFCSSLRITHYTTLHFTSVSFSQTYSTSYHGYVAY